MRSRDSALTGFHRPAAARGRWLVFGATFFWGTSATLARFIFHDLHVAPLDAVELRLAISVLLLAPWIYRRDRAHFLPRRADFAYFVVLGVAGVAAVQVSYYTSVANLGVGLAILVQYLAPTLIVLYDWARGRRARAATVTALGGALAGIALLVGGVDQRALHATLGQWAVAFSSAVFFAFYVVYSKRALDRYPPMPVLLHTFSIALMALLLVHPPGRILSAHYGPGTWALFGVLGVFSALVPFTLFYTGLRFLAPAEAGIIATIEPVVAVLSSAFFLGEGLRPLQWLGAVLVLAAAIIASRSRPSEPPAAGPP